MTLLERSWYRNGWLTFFLKPLSFLFKKIAEKRRNDFLNNDRKSWDAPVPVIVVGNITVGGTGKTPLVKALITYLKAVGYKPGIISRGYGGKAPQYPIIVGESDGGSEDAGIVGDEPLLLFRECHCPVVVDPNRPNAAKHLLSSFDCDLIISDDGLQHYALARDLEIAVIDTARQFGNGLCLPAGPLREPIDRLMGVDIIIGNGSKGLDLPPQLVECLREKIFTLDLTATGFIKVGEFNSKDKKLEALKYFQGSEVVAVAGIGNPQRFFNTLKGLVEKLVSRSFTDHHQYKEQDLAFANKRPVIMTSKDAVKCSAFSKDTWWYLDVEFDLPHELKALLQDKLSLVKLSKKEQTYG